VGDPAGSGSEVTPVCGQDFTYPADGTLPSGEYVLNCSKLACSCFR
jgi:hypothetical protein